MSNPLNTSFTLRPSKHGKHRAELTILEQQHIREVPPRVPLQRSCCENSGSSSIHECNNKLYHPPLKRQRLFMDRVGVIRSTLVSRDDVIPTSRYRRCDRPVTYHTHSSNCEIDFPFQGLPGDFDPPKDENFWQRRCLRMRDKYEECQGRIRDIEEDQRQLRRRIMELEEQLLIQSSVRSSTHPSVGECSPGRTHPKVVVDSNITMGVGTTHGGNTMGAKRSMTTPERNRPSPTRTGVHGNHDDGHGGVLIEETRPSREMIPSPPTRVVRVPKDPSRTHVASCFYLTDGEGLSDSDSGDILDDYMDDYYDEDEDDDDDRNDGRNHLRG